MSQITPTAQESFPTAATRAVSSLPILFAYRPRRRVDCRGPSMCSRARRSEEGGFPREGREAWGRC
eukprot:1537707-Rhodomonas_salina.1